MLRRVMEEFKRRLGIQRDLPDKPDELRSAFVEWLRIASAKHKVILVLDALNRLEDRAGAPDLVWLPPVIPTGIRLVVSTLTGRSLDNLSKRAWPTLEVKPLRKEERKQLIRDYLAQYTKTLDRPRVDRIASADQTSSPLFLRALIDELRVFGIHQELDTRIANYLTCPTVDKLHSKILERYEQDYEDNRPKLVRDTVSLLWASRRGLTENELLNLMGNGNERLQQAYWSPLFLQLEQWLINSGGMLSFSNDFLRQAVADRYLQRSSDRTSVHLRLARYFESVERGHRKVEELPWQLARAEAWEELFQLLANVAFFSGNRLAHNLQACLSGSIAMSEWYDSAKRFSPLDQLEKKSYWTQIEAKTSLRMVDAYRPVLEAPRSYVRDDVWWIAGLLADAGHNDEALQLRESLIDQLQDPDNEKELACALNNKAVLIMGKGDYAQGLELLDQSEEICRRIGDPESLQYALINKAAVLSIRGDVDEAIKVLVEVRKNAYISGRKDQLILALDNMARDHLDRGESGQALQLLSEAERVCREEGNLEQLATTIEAKAKILFSNGEWKSASLALQEQRQLLTSLGQKPELASCLVLMSEIAISMGDLEQATLLADQAAQLCEETGHLISQLEVVRIRAKILFNRGDLRQALVLSDQLVASCRNHQLGKLLSEAFAARARILKYAGESEALKNCLQEWEDSCLGGSDEVGLADCYFTQAEVLRDYGDLDAALLKYKHLEQLCRESNNLDTLHITLGNEASLEIERNEFDSALELLKEQQKICEELGNRAGLQWSLLLQAQILIDRDNSCDVMGILKEQEKLSRELGNTDGLQRNLGLQAKARAFQNKFEESLSLYREQQRLCTQLGKIDDLVSSLTGQAVILRVLNRQEEGSRCAEDAARIAGDHHLLTLHQRAKNVLKQFPID